MKIFDESKVSSIKSSERVTSETKSNGPQNVRSAKNQNRKNAKNSIEKKSISESEIREKLAANVEMSNTAKQAVAAKNTKKLGDGFMNEEKALQASIEKKLAPPVPLKSEEPEKEVEKSDDPNTKDHIIKSDVGINSPNDTGTTEKLKTILSKGAFNFNSKEREALDRILADR